MQEMDFPVREGIDPGSLINNTYQDSGLDLSLREESAEFTSR
jgi:hypothetical protein